MALDLPLRHFTGSFGATLRDALFLGAALVALVPRHGRWGGVSILIVCALALHLIVGLFVMGFDGVGVRQTGFGLKILLPFLAGLSLSPELFATGRRALFIYVSVLCVTGLGLLLDSAGAIDFLRSGVGISSDGFRQYGYAKIWAGPDIFRVSGFARIFTAASMMMCISLLMVVTAVRGLPTRLLIIAASAYPLWLTNSKTTFVAVALLLPVQMFRADTAVRLHKAFAATLVPLNIALPVLLSGLYYHLPISGTALTYSIVDRVLNTWPTAWGMFDRTGLWALGRGIGGIGAPQLTFAPNNFNAGDSLFIYSFAYFGVFSVAYLGLILFLVVRIRAAATFVTSQAAAIITFVLLEGLTSGIFEEPFTFFICGGAVAYFYRHPPWLGSVTEAFAKPASGDLVANQPNAA